MKLYKVTDAEFSRYGKVVDGLDWKALTTKLDETTPAPEAGTIYVPDDPALDSLSIFPLLRDNVYGGMPVQIGYCNGTNFKLNCLEYHRGSEVNVSSKPFILLLGKVDDMVGGMLDTATVKAFLVPADVAVQVYETTLHYAPCGDSFRVIVVLPKGTNEKKPDIAIKSDEDRLLWACNKWLLAHKDSSEAAQGAEVRLVGENISVEGLV